MKIPEKTLSAFFAFLACLAAADLLPPFDLIHSAAPRNNLLPVWMEFRTREKEYLASPEWGRNYIAAAAWVNSYLGEYRAALNSAESGSPPADPELRHSLEKYQPVDAVQAIAAAVQNRRVLMINEEHIDSSHRALTTEIIPILRKEGFRYFAAEAFGPDIESARYPKAGRYFTDDPVFGNLIRRAIELGFTLISYDVPSTCGAAQLKSFNTTGAIADDSCWEEREMGQARNLARFMETHPDAKLVVHGGMGHIQKTELPFGKLMALDFRELTKIDPLSIDQVYLGEAKAGTPAYRVISAKYPDRVAPFVLQSGGSFFLPVEAEGVDLAVVHPRAKYENGRPVWLSTGGWRKPVPINQLPAYRAAISKLRSSGTTLLQVFRTTDNPDAVPVDQILITEPLNPATLMLSDGDYRVRVVDRNDNTLVTFRVRAGL
jgi:hypothetical protein